MKTARAAAKANAGSKEHADRLASAEKSAKAARASARKAEKATSAKEAEKHAAAAKGHADAARSHAEGTSSPAPEVKAPAKASTATDATKLSSDASKSTDEAKAAGSKVAHQKAASDHESAQAAHLKAAKEPGADVAAHRAAVLAHGKASNYHHNEASVASDKPAQSAEVTKTEVTQPIGDVKGETVGKYEHSDMRKELTAKLSVDEHAAALKYSGPAYAKINAHLRKDGKPTSTIKEIDAAIAKAPAPKDLVVFRGQSGAYADKLATLREGDAFVQKGYSSTSAGDESAFGGSVEMRITVPKGHPAAAIPSHHPHEREVLLPRNSKFVVTKSEKVPNKWGTLVHVLHVTVVPNNEAPAPTKGKKR